MAFGLDTPAFSTRKRSARGSAPGNRAFMIEALVLLAFLAISVAILLQLFAQAGLLSRSAHTLSMSEHLATNAAEQFGANPLIGSSIAYYDDEGNRLEGNGDGATFAVETAVTSERTQTGTMHHANVTVLSFANNAAGETTYNLETQRYLSDTENGVIGGGSR